MCLCGDKDTRQLFSEFHFQLLLNQFENSSSSRQISQCATYAEQWILTSPQGSHKYTQAKIKWNQKATVCGTALVVRGEDFVHWMIHHFHFFFPVLLLLPSLSSFLLFPFLYAFFSFHLNSPAFLETNEEMHEYKSLYHKQPLSLMDQHSKYHRDLGLEGFLESHSGHFSNFRTPQMQNFHHLSWSLFNIDQLSLSEMQY